MYGKVDVAAQQRSFDLKRKHAFAADGRKRLSLLLVARGADNPLFNTQPDVRGL
jgi:hypothetical protein